MRLIHVAIAEKQLQPQVQQCRYRQDISREGEWQWPTPYLLLSGPCFYFPNIKEVEKQSYRSARPHHFTGFLFRKVHSQRALRGKRKGSSWSRLGNEKYLSENENRWKDQYRLTRKKQGKSKRERRFQKSKLLSFYFILKYPMIERARKKSRKPDTKCTPQCKRYIYRGRHTRNRQKKRSTLSGWLWWTCTFNQ